jgi:hypothetical protein
MAKIARVRREKSPKRETKRARRIRMARRRPTKKFTSLIAETRRLRQVDPHTHRR